MDFSEAYQFTGPTPVFSPDGKYVASAVESKCIIRDSETLIIYHMFSCMDGIKYIEWSPTGQHILCALYSRAVVQVWDINDPAWTCKVDGGPAGLLRALWSATGRDVLTIADFNLRISVWDLHTQSCVHRQGPKHTHKGIHFSKCGKHLAVLERVNLKDYIAIYTEGVPDDKCHRFRVSTSDADDFSWSPDGTIIAVCDSALHYSVFVYKAADGGCLKRFQLSGKGLGLRAVHWTPNSQFLAIGSYDNAVRVLNHITWNESAAFEHTTSVSADVAVIFAEVRDDSATDAEQLPHAANAADNGADADAAASRWRYEVQETSVEVPTAQPQAAKANPAMGVRRMRASPTGRFLATVNEAQRCALWLWDLQDLALVCLLQHQQPVASFEWDPLHDKLAVCTSGRRLHLWTPDGASCVHTPLPNLHSKHVTWRPDGMAAAVSDVDRFCIAYVA